MELPGLTADHIAHLNSSWSDGGLWEDSILLARRVLRLDGSEQTEAWHHLVMGVGNFKRQPGRRLHPPRLPRTDPGDVVGVQKVVIYSVELDCDADDVAVTLVSTLAGAGPATATAILAALWPADHIIYDWRVNAAANGLRLAAGLPVVDGFVPSNRSGVQTRAQDYPEVRGWVIDAAIQHDVEPVQVERALYELSRRARTDPTRTWGEYGAHLVDLLHALPGTDDEMTGETDKGAVAALGGRTLGADLPGVEDDVRGNVQEVYDPFTQPASIGAAHARAQ